MESVCQLIGEVLSKCKDSTRSQIYVFWRTRILQSRVKMHQMMFWSGACLVQAVVHTVDVGDVVETLVAGQCCLTNEVVFIPVGGSAKESTARLEKA